MSMSEANKNGKGHAPATVLVIDEEPRVRDLIIRWLTADGHRCAQAATAQAAWEHLQAHEVHLVVLDIKMPEGSGIDLFRQIGRTYPDTSVIMIGGVEESAMAIEALIYGACAYLFKPVKRDQLIFHARRTLEKRQLAVDDRQYLERLEQRVRERTDTVRQAYEETIQRLLAACTWRDEETSMHLRRTGLLGELLATAASWSAPEAEDIRLAAPMHDIGKLGVAESILHKPGKLSPDECEAMKRHTLIGARMLAGSDSRMLRMAAEIALGHHEHWDGSGYPAGLSGHAIPESARIVAIVDAFDGLIHDAACRPALPEIEALAIMQKGAGSQFDPLLLAGFFSRFEDISRIVRENQDEATETEPAVRNFFLAWSDGAPAQPPMLVTRGQHS